MQQHLLKSPYFLHYISKLFYTKVHWSVMLECVSCIFIHYMALPSCFHFSRIFLLTYRLSWHLVNYFKGMFFNFYGNSHWNFLRQLYNLHISFICIEDLVIIFVYERLTIFHLFVSPLVSFISVLQFLLHNTYSLLLFIDNHFILLDYTKDGWFSWFLFKWVINVKKCNWWWNAYLFSCNGITYISSNSSWRSL